MDELYGKTTSLTQEQRESYRNNLMPFNRAQVMHLKGGKGVWIEDIDGKQYIDLSAQMFACYLGIGNEEIAEAIYEQAKIMTTVHPLFQTDLRYSLVNKLASIAPKNLNRVSFSVGGGPAIESAMKIALKNVAGSKNFISLWGGYHGGTFASAGVTYHITLAQNTPGNTPSQFGYLSNIGNNCIRVPHPYCYRCPFHQKPETCDLFCAEALRQAIINEVHGPVAGIIIEPIQSAGGQFPLPAGYLREIRHICDEFGTVLIFDEIQTFCRTGHFFAAEYYGVEPDIIVAAKGLGAGVPIACIIIHDRLKPFEDLMEDLHTFQNNHIGMAAALKTIQIIERDKLLENVTVVGDYIIDSLHRMQEKYPEIGDIRGVGLAIGVEMVKDPKTKVPMDASVMQMIMNKSIENGVYYQIQNNNIIKIKPPLTINKEEVDISLEAISKAFKTILRR